MHCFLFRYFQLKIGSHIFTECDVIATKQEFLLELNQHKNENILEMDKHKNDNMFEMDKNKKENMLQLNQHKREMISDIRLISALKKHYITKITEERKLQLQNVAENGEFYYLKYYYHFK